MKLLQTPLKVPYFGKYCSLKLSTKDRAIEENVRLADHLAEATFMQKERYVELEAESVRVKRKWQRRKPELRALRERT